MEVSEAKIPEKPSRRKKTPDLGVIRPELNLEKWPALWEPAKSRRVFKTRIIEREITFPDGNTVTARVRIAPSTEGSLTTEEQKHFYGLIHIWEEAGREIEPATYFSMQRLAKVLKKGWGARTIETMTESLTRLLATTIFWENAYYDKMTGETKKELHGFHILEELYISHTAKDGHVTTEACYFRFNGLILKNLLANYTKPVLLDTVLGLQNDIAQILYTYLDLIMADKEFFKRRTKELFDEIGLRGAAYQNVSDRKRTLERAIKRLEGVPITTGYLAAVGLERTVDQKDFNLTIRKGRGKPKAIVAQLSVAPQPQVSIVPEKNVETNTALEQVRFFYEVFFQSGQTVHPADKELLHAREHIKRHGQDGARYIVTFAHREAPKTKFEIQNYGGICGYEARAITEFETKQQKKRIKDIEEARKNHYNRFYAAYRTYLRETLNSTESDASEAFMAFLDHDAQQREKYIRQKLTVYLRQTFDTEEDRLTRFAEFFRTHDGYTILDFWQWDEAKNPERFTSENI